MTEEWREVPGWEGFYAVSSIGRVKRLAGSPKCIKDRILVPVSVRKGYQTVVLTKPGNKPIRKTLHALVALSFLGERPTDKHEVNHLNGIKTDNRVENLQWVTRSENIKHAFDTGLKPALCGSNAPSAKLSETQVKEIIALHAQGKKIRELVKMFPVGDYAIRQIVLGRSHTHHERPENPVTLKGAVALDREKVLAAKRMLFEEGLSAYKVAKALGIGATTAYAIQKGKIWAHINP
jgi:hypothetical protein